MINILFKPGNIFFSLDKTITEIIIDDPEVLRNLFINVEESIIISEDIKEIKFEKTVLTIINPFEMMVNDKKNINLLYKALIANASDGQKEKLRIIERESINCLDDILDTNDYNLEYNAELDLSRFLNMFQVQFKEVDANNYLEYLIDYIKINVNLYGYKIVISYSLIDLLSKSEINSLEKELQLINIKLVDIKTNKQCKIDVINDNNEFILI